MKTRLGRLIPVLALWLMPLCSVRAQTLGEALDAPGLAWTNGGSWAPQTNSTYDGIDAAGSYVYAYNDSWIETTVTGPTAVSFWFCIDVYGYGGYMQFSIDGVEQLLAEDWWGWHYAVHVIPEGTHVLRWTLFGGLLSVDPWGGASGGATGYLDQVTLLPIAPEIEILGRNSIGITNGATTTSTNNGTDFSAVFLTDATSDCMFTVRNWGVTNLEISSVAIGGTHSGDFQVVAYPNFVAANAFSNLILRFDPVAVGGRTAVVTIANNDADEGSYSFAVSGTGIADGSYIRVYGNAGQLITNGCPSVTNALGTDFGWQYLAGASTSRTFFVANAGNSVLNISAVNLAGANPGDFAVLSYPATVSVGARSNVVVQFDPAAIGVREAVVEISSDAVEAATYAFSVGGLGVPDVPEILVLGTNGLAVLDGDLSPAFADGTYFGGAPAFSGTADRTFRITNSGSADLVIGGVEFQGGGAGHFSAPAVPARIRPGTVSNLTLRFSPAAAGVLTALVAIANNDADENPYEFAVRGDGTAAHYVWTNCPDPTPPYLTWETAARTIQDAVGVCVDGDVVWVTNGVYDAGGVYYGGDSNRVCITNVVRVQSVNGPEVTSITGANGIRGIYLGLHASLAGFTITNGHASNFGGGVYADSSSAVVSNCIVAGNQSGSDGGGIYRATTYDSVISGNIAANGGGGAASAVLHRSQLIGNQAGGSWYEECCEWDFWASCIQSADVLSGGGGGSYQSTLHSCLLEGNIANAGGGAASSSLYNCTLAANQANAGGGGMINGTAVNCVFVDNTDSGNPANNDWVSYFGCRSVGGLSITYSCLTNPPAGTGNINGRATFMPDTYQLAPGSLGINAGNNASVQGPTDLAGNPRISNGTVDLGAYEYQLPDEDGDGIPDEWENGHGLSASISNAPTADSDGDGRPDLEEYWADTHPTNGASHFPMVVVTNPPLGTMVLMVEPTSTARVYGIRWTTNLLSNPQIWTLIPPEKTGTGSAVSFTVTNDAPGRIYRTGVRLP